MNQQVAKAVGTELLQPTNRVPDSKERAQKGKEHRRPVGAKTYKIQIQLSEKAKERLFELVDRTEAESAAQVVRDALRVYDILNEEVDEKGNDLLLRSGSSGETVLLRLF